MKLSTSIPPRRDGTVRVEGLDKRTYLFMTDDSGELVGEVSHEPTVAFLLQGGLFYPADPGDYDAALRLAGTGDDDGDVDGDHDEEQDENAPPIEAGTPPKQASARAVSGRAPRGAAKR